MTFEQLQELARIAVDLRSAIHGAELDEGVVQTELHEVGDRLDRLVRRLKEGRT